MEWNSKFPLLPPPQIHYCCFCCCCLCVWESGYLSDEKRLPDLCGIWGKNRMLRRNSHVMIWYVNLLGIENSKAGGPFRSLGTDISVGKYLSSVFLHPKHDTKDWYFFSCYHFLPSSPSIYLWDCSFKGSFPHSLTYLSWKLPFDSFLKLLLMMMPKAVSLRTT